MLRSPTPIGGADRGRRNKGLPSAMQPRDLHAALDPSRIEARFQPIVRMSDRVPVALEALARIDHPELGLVMADRFVPQLEQAGLGRDLTDQVAASTVAALARDLPWLADLSIGINLPLDLLVCAGTLERLAALRDAAGVAPGRLALELTETQPVDDPVALGRALERARRAGFETVIDDVGPAMHWVEALLDLPFTGLKLDAALLAPDAPAAFAGAIVARAHRCGLVVTAEGIEDAGDWARARALGADRGQGFAIGPALTAAALQDWRMAWAEPVAAVG